MLAASNPPVRIPRGAAAPERCTQPGESGAHASWRDLSSSRSTRGRFAECAAFVLRKELSTGKFVAVKRMPVSWTGLNHKDLPPRLLYECVCPFGF